MNLLDKLLFKSIDTLNKKGAHTNPLRIKENIRKFLEKTSKEFIGYLNNSSIGADIGSGYGILSDVLKPIRVYNLDINPPTSGYLPQIKGDAEKLPFKDNSLDFVLFFILFLILIIQKRHLKKQRGY